MFVCASLQRAGGIGDFFESWRLDHQTEALASVVWAQYVCRTRRKGCLLVGSGERAQGGAVGLRWVPVRAGMQAVEPVLPHLSPHPLSSHPAVSQELLQRDLLRQQELQSQPRDVWLIPEIRGFHPRYRHEPPFAATRAPSLGFWCCWHLAFTTTYPNPAG